MKTNELNNSEIEEYIPYIVNGWKVVNPPPKITLNGYGESPSASSLLQKAVRANVKNQEITPNNPSSANLSVTKFGIGLHDDWFTSNNLPKPFNKDKYFELNLELPIGVDVSFVMKFAADMKAGPLCDYSIIVNDKYPVALNNDSNNNPHNVGLVIPSTYLQKGSNKISVSGNLNIFSFQVSTVIVDVGAYSYWKQIDGRRFTDGNDSLSLETTTGTITADSETKAFAKQIGVSVTGTEGLLFEKISEQLSGTFTWTDTKQHTVTVNKSKTTKRGFTINVPKGYNSVNYQIWQLVLRFNSNGLNLDIAQEYFYTSTFPQK